MIDPTRGAPEPSRPEPPQRFSWSHRSDDGPLSSGRGQPVLEDPFLRATPQAPPPVKRAPWLAIVAVTSSVLFLCASAVAVWLWRSAALLQAAAPPGSEAPPPALDPPDPVAPLDPGASTAPGASADPSAAASSDPAPSKTKVTKVGAIVTVDLSPRAASSLVDALRGERELAKAEGQTLLLMTTRFGTKEFRDVDAALSDPLLQTALTSARLVRVDVLAFEEDLEDLGMPTDRVPGFFLLGPDLVPRDGIDGGEWDDDIPRNIAPVLGAFMRGSYRARRTMWKPPPSRGVNL